MTMYNPSPIHARAASPNPMVGINRSRSPGPLMHGVVRPLSRGPSPAPPLSAHGAIGSGFKVEKRARSPNPMGRQAMPHPNPALDYHRSEEALFRDHVSALISAKDSQFAVSGRIPIDPAQLVLFFRSKTGVAHSLDFPIDVSYNTPPALDVLIAACRPHPTSDFHNNHGSQQHQQQHNAALFYPTNLPMTSSLEIANYPILDAIRDSLFPTLPPGKRFSASLDRLDVVDSGSRLAQQQPTHANHSRRNKLDGGSERAATIVVNLPVRFRGGAVVVRDPHGREEVFQTTGGKNGDVDWIALRGDCGYEVQPVQKGVFVSISYGVYVRSFGPAASNASDTLVTPSDAFFNLLSPILNMSRGQTVAFYLKNDYVANPADAVANALIPQLKGGDALLFDAFKFHKLVPDLHWTAGGFVWPVDHTLEFFIDDVPRAAANNPINPLKMRSPSPNPGYGRLPLGGGGGAGVRGGYGGNPISAPSLQGGGYDDDGGGNALGPRVQASGAISFAEANLTLLTDLDNPTPVIGKQPVEFVSNGELTKLVVNVLLVVFIP